MPRAGNRQLRIGEHDRERRAPRARLYVGIARGVLAREPPFVRGLVQERQIVARVAGDEDRMAAALHRRPVEQRDAARIERERCLVEPEPPDVRRASGRRDHEIHARRALYSIRSAVTDDDAVADALDRAHVGGGLERELLLKRLCCVCANRRIAERTDVTAAAEEQHVDAQPVQRLTELETDDTGTEDRDRAGQIVPRENIVVDDQPIARRA